MDSTFTAVCSYVTLSDIPFRTTAPYLLIEISKINPNIPGVEEDLQSQVQNIVSTLNLASLLYKSIIIYHRTYHTIGKGFCFKLVIWTLSKFRPNSQEIAGFTINKGKEIASQVGHGKN